MISFKTDPLLPASSQSALDIRAQNSSLQNGDWDRVYGMFDKVQDAFNRIESVMRAVKRNQFNEIIVTDAGGAFIGWIGSRDGYFGGWLKQLYVGASGPDTAPLFADANGNVIIGKNGSLSIQDSGQNEVGWLGVQSDAAKAITNATNATPIVITSTAHGYENGDTVLIAGVGGNTAANGYRIVQSVTADTYALTTLAGANVAGNGVYTSGGTGTRYFGGGRFQTVAVGSSFTSYKIRAYADGQVKIKDALITLTDVANNGYIELNPSTGPKALFRNTSTGAQTRIQNGFITIENSNPGNSLIYFDYGGAYLVNSTGRFIFVLDVSLGASRLAMRTSGGNQTILASGSDGKVTLSNGSAVTGVVLDPTNEEIYLNKSGFQTILISGFSRKVDISDGFGIVINLDGTTGTVGAKSYKVNGVAGADSGPTAYGVSLNVGTGTAITSVNFVTQTTTSGTFVTSVTLNTVTRQWTKGILTT